jgi:hypothetical protein
MKRLLFIIVLLFATEAGSQSVLTYGAGTSVGVFTGADLCANIKFGSGILYGSGTFCACSIIINTISTEIPDRFDMQQNYPNPFNPTTKIKFDIATHSVGQTFLSVFDLRGREITTLVNEQLQPGTYEVTFDGSNLPSGVYFYKLSSGDYSDTKKMILMK